MSLCADAAVPAAVERGGEGAVHIAAGEFRTRGEAVGAAPGLLRYGGVLGADSLAEQEAQG